MDCSSLEVLAAIISLNPPGTWLPLGSSVDGQGRDRAGDVNVSPQNPSKPESGGAMDTLHICTVLPLIPAPHLPSSQSVCDEEGDRKSGRTVLFLCTCYFRTHRTYALGTASGAGDNL